MSHVPAFLVAGTKSGCGKTSVSLGLMAALARRGLRVQPFKAGPDFIDPGHHVRAASLGFDRPVDSHNLDTWMLPRATVREIFERYAGGSGNAPDVAIVEGVMGLYDGLSGARETGSSAHLAKTLDLPVVLVADAASLARSAAALVRGYAEFDPDLTVAGVILNNVASDNHAEMLREAMTLVDVPLLGLLPRRESVSLPGRHLGLVTAEDLGRSGKNGHVDSGGGDDEPYLRLADWVEGNLDLDALLGRVSDLLKNRQSQLPEPLAPLNAKSPKAKAEAGPRVRLGVARDRAFCFCYPENLRLLEQAGAEIVFFSPLNDRALPEGLDGLYLPGGYPELHAARLEDNASMRRQVLDLARSGRPVYAECGGFMYLLRVLADQAGRWYGMAGVFDAGAEMENRFSALGYREVRTTAETLLGPSGTVLRGHEFHYSRLAADPPKAEPVYQVTGRTGAVLPVTGWHKGATLGSYVHLHLGSNPEAAGNFVQAMISARG